MTEGPMIRLLYYTPFFFCKNSTFPYLTRPLSIKHEGRDFKTIPLALFAHAVSGRGHLYKYSLSSKNMTIFDYLLPLKFFFTIISVKRLPPSHSRPPTFLSWITFQFVDGGEKKPCEKVRKQNDEIYFEKTAHGENTQVRLSGLEEGGAGVVKKTCRAMSGRCTGEEEQVVLTHFHDRVFSFFFRFFLLFKFISFSEAGIQVVRLA